MCVAEHCHFVLWCVGCVALHGWRGRHKGGTGSLCGALRAARAALCVALGVPCVGLEVYNTSGIGGLLGMRWGGVPVAG